MIGHNAKCPFCGGKNLSYVGFANISVECTDCRSEGPIINSGLRDKDTCEDPRYRASIDKALSAFTRPAHMMTELERLKRVIGRIRNASLFPQNKDKALSRIFDMARTAQGGGT
jgi:hypothetical protein